MVEWHKLVELANITIGEFVRRDKQNPEGKYPVYNGGTTYTGFYDFYNNEGKKIVISARGNAGFVNRVFEKYWAGNSSYSIDITSDKTTWDFVYYYLKEYQYDLMSLQQKGGGLAAISKKQVEDIEIPIPSLSEQNRIVRILDSFTSSIDNLKEQIAQRRKQFEYYRDQLLDQSGKDGIEWKSLGEIGKMTRGNGLQKNDFRDSGFPCIHYGQIHTYYGTSAFSTKSFCDVVFAKKLKKAHCGDLLIATTSEDVEACCKAVAWLGNEDVAYSGDSYCFSHNQNPKYISYLFQTEQFAIQKRKVATGAKVVRVSGESMEKFIFPFPRLEEQAHIVSILDTFESSINNLEAQLALRQKQYEYYRNKLLTFE